MAVEWKKLAFEDDVVLVADTSLVGCGFFLDEDDMASDDNTKVPSQQSVKKYVDDNAGGISAMLALAYGSI